MFSEHIKEELEEFLRKLGFKGNSLYRIRFGGVVGKIALLGFVSLAAVGVVAWKAPDSDILWGCLGTIIILGLPTIGAILYFGHKHPLEATLEGGEIVALRGIENQFAARGVTVIPDQPLVTRALDLIAPESSPEGKNQ